jgi:hypothetical protein
MTDNKNEAGNLLPSVVNYNYNGNSIRFNVNGNVMVSATNMAKPFSKRPTKWLELPTTKEFLLELSKVRNLTLGKPQICGLPEKAMSDFRTLADFQANNSFKSYYDGLVVTNHGGSNPGTWFHEDVALEFARWLSPAFAIWCNDRIKEILIAKLMQAKPTRVVRPKAIDTTEKDREIAHWKSLFLEAMETVKSMHESNKLAQNSFNVLYSVMKGR